MSTVYAILPSRVKAIVIDSLIIIAAMYGISEVLNLFENVSIAVKMTCFALILLYDPFFTSFYGGTIGHSYSDIAVKKDGDKRKNISFLSALVRYLLKMFLGWVSLLTVTGNDKKKAIHDFVVRSIVIETK